MTEIEKLNDMNYEVDLSPSLSVSTITNDSSIFYNMLTSSSRYSSDSSDINLNVGIAAFVTASIAHHVNRLIARERINNKHIVDNMIKNEINDAKHICTGLCFFKR